jgi:putative phosphoribosyl transferase
MGTLMFRDREDGGRRLVEKLEKYSGSDSILLAIPRGGVIVAYVISKSLNIPVDVIIVRKIGHPFNPEYAVGAVGVDGSFIQTVHSQGVSKEYIDREVKEKQIEAKERYVELRNGKPPLNLKDKSVIIVDDGIATGSTMLMAVEIVKKQKPDKIVIAAPVAPPDTVSVLKKAVDEVIVLLEPEGFMAIGQFYEDFRQVPTEEAKRLLEEL